MKHQGWLIKLLFTGSVCTLLLSAAGASPLPTGHQSSAPSFNDLDTDGDGLLSPEEAASTSPLDSHFPMADMNQDGSVDESEFSVFEALVDTVPGPPGDSI